ncbi:MAG TPA: zinc-binding dehydrogenase [Anaerolineae bacterium]|nr:zinc-binding dehydrogenase [Anaerolineae bacterium]
MAEKMKLWRIYAPGDLRFEIADIPTPGPDQALLKVELATTCGTDLKIYKRGHARMTFPDLFGHEVVGTVVAKGDQVTNVKLGDRVATAALGAFAEYVVVPAPMSTREMPVLPDGIPPEAAAMTEPFACAYHGTLESNIKIGDQVVVLGCGPIGLMFVRLALMSGASVIAADFIPSRLEIARQVGAEHTVNFAQVDDPVQAVRSLTENGAGVDIAIEAVGLPKAWEQALYMIRRGGLVTFFGGCEKGATVTLDTEFIHYEEARMQGVFNYHHPEHFHKAFKLIQRGALDPKIFVTDHAPLQDTEKVFQRLAKGYEGVKIAIHPE